MRVSRTRGMWRRSCGRSTCEGPAGRPAGGASACAIRSMACSVATSGFTPPSPGPLGAWRVFLRYERFHATLPRAAGSMARLCSLRTVSRRPPMGAGSGTRFCSLRTPTRQHRLRAAAFARACVVTPITFPVLRPPSLSAAVRRHSAPTRGVAQGPTDHASHRSRRLEHPRERLPHALAHDERRALDVGAHERRRRVGVAAPGRSRGSRGAR